MKYIALLGVMLWALACGSKTDHGGFVAPGSDGGTGGQANLAGASGRGTAGHAGKVAIGEGGAAGSDIDALAPVVSITSPEPVNDPNEAKPISDPQVVITCSAKASDEPGAANLAASSVKILLFGSDGKQIGMPGNVHSTDNADEYAATFTLTEVPDGPVSFVCAASDSSMPVHSASATLSTFVDHGPSVTLKSPLPSSAHAVTPALTFDFTALPVPLLDGDKGAEVTSVALKVYGVVIDDVAAHELPKVPGEYKLDIDLNDPKLFFPTPIGPVPVRIVATNKRGTVRTSDFTFNVDSVGPVIQIVSPAKPNQFVGGKVTLTFTVTDSPAGVDPATAQVILNQQAFLFDAKNGWTYTPSTNTFTFTFDTHQFEAGGIYLSVNIRATDLAGNDSAGAAIQYTLDNRPPIIDMAPPALQEIAYNAGNSLCSQPFPPLGESPQDLEIVNTLTRPRALIWDVGNVQKGQDAFYFSDVDNANTNVMPHLYFQPDTSKPLLKNADPTKHGATCDAIADETLPLVTLTPLTPTGNAYFPSTAPPHTIDPTCKAGTETTKPLFLCNGASDLSRVIQHEAFATSSGVPVVYVIPTDSLQCTGTQFQLTNVAKEGWVCLAVAARDQTGNRAVSAPLRLCLDDPANDDLPNGKGHPACATMSLEAPSCVSDCVPPPHFSPGLIQRPHDGP